MTKYEYPVAWVSASGRRYRGTIVRAANERVSQVRSVDGFLWLIPNDELELVGTNIRKLRLRNAA
jgi:hypothetical protein